MVRFKEKKLGAYKLKGVHTAMHIFTSFRQKETGTTEDETVGWHHQHDEHEFAQAPGDGEGQGGLACCSPWGHKELDTTERLN